MRRCIIVIVMAGLIATSWGCSRLDTPIHPVKETVVAESEERAETQKHKEPTIPTQTNIDFPPEQETVKESLVGNKETLPEEPPIPIVEKDQVEKENVQPDEVTEDWANIDRSKSDYQPLHVTATAYSHNCGTGDGITATGTKVRPGVIAVDPSVIPYGTEVFIEGYGHFVAEDTGGAIKGNKIDIFMDSEEQMVQFGVQQLRVWL